MEVNLKELENYCDGKNKLSFYTINIPRNILLEDEQYFFIKMLFYRLDTICGYICQHLNLP